MSCILPKVCMEVDDLELFDIFYGCARTPVQSHLLFRGERGVAISFVFAHLHTHSLQLGFSCLGYISGHNMR